MPNWKKLIVSGSSAELTTLKLTGLSGGSSTKAVMVDGSNNLETRTLGSNAFNSTTIPSAANNATITITAGNALTTGGNFTTNQSSNETITIHHQDTSTQSSVNNSGNTVIQDVTLDTYGHVTGLTSKTLTIPSSFSDLTVGEFNISEFNNDAGYTTNTGTMSSWIIKEGNGSETATVTNGETVTIEDGTGIQSELTSTSSGGTITITNTAPANDSTINVNAGAGLQNGFTFTTNQSSDQTGALALSVNSLTNTTAGSNAQRFIVGTTMGANYRIDAEYINLSGFNNDSGFTTNAGTVTSVSVGTGLDVSNSTTTPSITLDLSEFTDMTAAINNEQDELILLDNGAERRKLISEIPLSAFNNDSGFTTTSGDITGVTAGNALTGGGTSGTVTINHQDTSTQSSVNNSGNTVIQDITLDTYGHVTALGSKTLTIPAAVTNNAELDNGAGYTTNTGTVTSVSTGTGLDGSFTTSGTITLDLSELTDMTAAVNSEQDELILLDNGAERRKLISEIGLSAFNNDSGFTTNTGDITGVTAGNALTGGGTSGTVTINHQDTSTQSSVNNSGNTVIQDVTLDTYGHVTGLTSKTLSIPSSLSELEIGEVNVSEFVNDSGYTTNTGTVTGTGASGRVALWSGTSGLTSDSGILYNAGSDQIQVQKLKVGYGTSSSPTIMVSGQSDTGIYWVYNPEAIHMSINGSERSALSEAGLKIVNASLGVNTNANSTNGRVDASNDVVAFSSDKRLKENIKPIKSALDKVDSLSGFTFNWNELAEKEAGFSREESFVGVFAQDVESVLPEAVKRAPFDNDGNDGSISGENYLTVQYEKLVPLLIESIKELKSEIEELKKGK